MKQVFVRDEDGRTLTEKSEVCKRLKYSFEVSLDVREVQKEVD